MAEGARRGALQVMQMAKAARTATCDQAVDILLTIKTISLHFQFLKCLFLNIYLRERRQEQG